MRLEVSRQKRMGRSGETAAYVVAAALRVSNQERNDINSHGLTEYELDLDAEDDDAEVVPLPDLLAGREFTFGNVQEAATFEEQLLAAASEFAQLLIDSLEFGGSDEYELPLEDIDEDEDEE